jgi:hypothetical protein
MTPKEKQQREALERANKVRYERAQFKREIKAGEVSLADLLREGVPECLEKEKAEKLLQAAPRVGPRAARKLLERAGASQFRLAGDLTWRQRVQIAGQLDLKERAREIAQRDEDERAERLAAA